MAHLAKYARGAVGNMLAHYDRTKKEIKNVDRSLSFLNYNCAEYQTLPQYEFIKQRLSEVHCSKRKDVNIFADWVVTAPREIDNMNLRLFFQAAYDFLEKKYGRENVISAYVHMDEQTPHMHFAFIPVVWDKKNNREKVSAKELLTVKHLKSFHHELKKSVEDQLGFEVSILNKATIEGNRSIEELKRKSATERMKEIDDVKEAEMAKIKELSRRTIENAKVVEEVLEEEKKVSEKAWEIQKQYVIDSLKSTEKSPSWIKVSEKGFGKNKQKFVTVPEEEWNRRSIYSTDVEALKTAHKTLQENIEKWRLSTSGHNFLALANKNLNLEKENESLKSQVQALKQENSLLKAFKSKWEFLKDKVKALIRLCSDDKDQICELEREYGVSDGFQQVFDKTYEKRL